MINNKQLVFISVGCLLSIDRSIQLANNKKYPTYSLDNMPRTAFSCRDKILGGYYADADTQCQMFHVCVKVAGVGVSAIHNWFSLLFILEIWKEFMIFILRAHNSPAYTCKRYKKSRRKNLVNRKCAESAFASNI